MVRMRDEEILEVDPSTTVGHTNDPFPPREHLSRFY